MGRDLDSTMAAALPAGVISPAFMAQLTFKSGVQYVWSGVGDLVWNGNTYTGVGNLASVGAITEGVAVQAEGTSVTLSGIGLSTVAWPPPLATPPSPPFTPPAGQSVAWAFPTQSSPPEAVWNYPGTAIIGTSSCTLTSGTLEMTGGDPIGANSVNCLWSGFNPPLMIPPGAVIAGIYPVVVLSIYLPGAPVMFLGAASSSLSETFGPALGTNTGGSVGTSFASLQISATIADSVIATINAQMGISFIGYAVYYEGTPLSAATLMYEAMSDVRIGGPAKIWFGLMAGGAFIGNPYLVFSGSVDKPSVNTSPDTNTITLALENRLVNLQRPNNRKYTTADQHISYPDDLGFSFVEILQEISLKEGS